MMTLREFVEKVNFHEQFRVYQPNRDCLIYESYFKVHSPYYFDDKHECCETNWQYWNDNPYNRDVYLMKDFDEETKVFLDKFGNYEVFSLECSGFRPIYMHTVDGKLVIDDVKDEGMPHRDYLDCFNVFIR